MYDNMKMYDRYENVFVLNLTVPFFFIWTNMSINNVLFPERTKIVSKMSLFTQTLVLFKGNLQEINQAMFNWQVWGSLRIMHVKGLKIAIIMLFNINFITKWTNWIITFLQIELKVASE